MAQHKWYNEIVAWASGAEIEMWYPQYDGWGDCLNPMFDIKHKYRIKPQPKEPQYLYAFEHIAATGLSFRRHHTILPNEKYIGKIKLEIES